MIHVPTAAELAAASIDQASAALAAELGAERVAAAVAKIREIPRPWGKAPLHGFELNGKLLEFYDPAAALRRMHRENLI